MNDQKDSVLSLIPVFLFLLPAYKFSEFCNKHFKKTSEVTKNEE